MKNFVQYGDTISLIAPYALVSGTGFLVGALFAVAVFDAANGAPVEGRVEGVFTLPKTAAQAWTQGQKVYWDSVNKRCDSDGTVGPLIGAAAEAAANPSGIGTVRLNGDVAGGLEGPQAAVPDVAAANANDLASVIALANASKATINALLAELRIAGIILP